MGGSSTSPTSCATKTYQGSSGGVAVAAAEVHHRQPGSAASCPSGCSSRRTPWEGPASPRLPAPEAEAGLGGGPDRAPAGQDDDDPAAPGASAGPPLPAAGE